jgi:hypothetical protein
MLEVKMKKIIVVSLVVISLFELAFLIGGWAIKSPK